MLGRVTASQMAAASAASFLPRLPLIRYGATNLGAINLTVWPKRLNSLAQWWAPEQASMPIRQGGNWATISSNCPRTTLGLINTALPLWSTPCKANTFLARSMPTVTIPMDFPFRMNDSVWKLNHGSNCCRRLPPLLRDGEVPFIR